MRVFRHSKLGVVYECGHCGVQWTNPRITRCPTCDQPVAASDRSPKH